MGPRELARLEEGEWPPPGRRDWARDSAKGVQVRRIFYEAFNVWRNACCPVDCFIDCWTDHG